MMKREPHILRDLSLTWRFDGSAWHCIGALNEDEARDISLALGVPLSLSGRTTQAQFAHDVALERFGLHRGGRAWGERSCGVPIWARL